MEEYLSEGSIRVVVVGVVAMAAVAVGAAAITSVSAAGPATTDVSEDPRNETIIDPQPRTPSDPGEPTVTPHGDPAPPEEPIDLNSCVQPLASWYGGAVYFGAFAAIVVFVRRRYSLGASMFGFFALAPPAFLSYFLATDCPTWGGPGPGPGPVLTGPSDGPVTDPLITTVDVPAAAVLGVFGVVLVGTAAVLLRASSDQTIEVEEREPAGDDGDPVDPRDIAVAAGQAADRLAARDADVDNEVYRAWWEMTRLLDVADPDTATPGEFADAAVAVGMTESDVAELTRLFEAVRYGERDPAGREERALSVFRSIESAYVDPDGPTGDGTDESADGTDESNDAT